MTKHNLDPSAIEELPFVTSSIVLDQSMLSAMIEPFVPGMGRHITPIKYEALTPDLSCVLFRTVGTDDQYYFVLLTYDFIPTLKDAQDIIVTWHGAVIEYIMPSGDPAHTEQNLQSVSYAYNTVYKGLLARVNRPTGNGYWATHFLLNPGDDVDVILAHLSDDQRRAIKNGLAKINKKDAKVSVYITPKGGYELFFT